MQLGISTYTYGWAIGVPDNLPIQPLTETALLEKANSFGLKLVQFGDNLPLHTFPSERLKHLQQTAAQQQIILETGARGLTEEHLQQYISITKALHSNLLRFVIDSHDYQPTIPQTIAIIKKALPLLEQYHITLGLENHDRLSAREFAHILDAVGSDRVGVCLDSVNSMGAGEGLEQIVNTLAPYTVNLHIKDFGIRRLPHLMGFQIDGRPAGKGMLNVPWLLEKIIPYSRCKTAVLEQWVIPENDIETTVQKEEAWAVESINYLKQCFNF